MPQRSMRWLPFAVAVVVLWLASSGTQARRGWQGAAILPPLPAMPQSRMGRHHHLGEIDVDDPKRLLGWSLNRDRRGYLRAFRRKQGRLLCVYLGMCADGFGGLLPKLLAANQEHGLYVHPVLTGRVAGA